MFFGDTGIVFSKHFCHHPSTLLPNHAFPSFPAESLNPTINTPGFQNLTAKPDTSKYVLAC